MVDTKKLHLGLCNEAMHIFTCLFTFAAFKMCVLFLSTSLSYSLCGKLIFFIHTSQNPVTIALGLLNIDNPSEKPNPLTRIQTWSLKTIDWSPSRGSPGNPLLTIFLPDCDLALTFFGKRMSRRGKSWLSFWHVILLSV